MKKLGWVLIANIVLLAIWLVMSQGDTFTRKYDVNMTVESDVPEEMVEEVRAALEVFPDEVIEAFVTNEWKLVVLTSFEDNEEYESISDDSIVGLINYEKKTITIKGVPKFAKAAVNITVHEMCHFVDQLWGDVSCNPKFIALYETYKDGKYITYSYSGVSVAAEYETDIYYATSSVYEFWAESYKDYLLHPEYMEEHYREISNFYRLEKFRR